MRLNEEAIVGAAFVVIHSMDRFNTPATNRSSTTAFRYFSGMGLYTAVILTLFYVLIRFPELVKAVVGDVQLSEHVASLSTPLLAALLVTVLLPTLPFLSAFDHKTRTKVYRLVSIPTEAKRLSEGLRAAAFDPSATLRERTKAYLQELDWATEDVSFAADRTIQSSWTMTTVLVQGLAGLESQPRFSDFLQSSDEYRRLKSEYSELGPEVLESLRLLRLDVEHHTPQGATALRLVEASLRSRLEELSTAVFDLLSRATLQCTFTQTARNQLVASFGFTLEAEPRLAWDQTVLLFSMLTAVTALGCVLSHPTSIGDVLVFGLAIATAVTSGIMSSIWPKRSWRFAQRKDRGGRPFAFYLCAGVMGLATTSGVLYAVLALAHWSWLIPIQLLYNGDSWLILAFLFAALVAYHIDSKPTAAGDVEKLRRKEGLTMALLALVASLCIRWDLYVRGHGEFAPSLVVMLLCPALAGLVIGYNVPTWFRALDAQTKASVAPPPMAAALAER